MTGVQTCALPISSKRRRRTILPTDLLFFFAVAVTFCVVYVAALNLHEIMLEGRSDLKEMLTPLTNGKYRVPPGPPTLPLAAAVPGIDVPFVPSTPSQPQDETPPPTHLSAYSQVYLEKEVSLLGDDVSNTGLEAVKHTDEWKSAANWDHDFVQMNQTFNLGMAPPLPPALDRKSVV